MVNYNCQQCGYNTSRKSVFKNHLLRKNLCKPISKKYTQYALLLLNGFNEDAKMYKNIRQKPPYTANVPPKPAKNIK